MSFVKCDVAQSPTPPGTPKKKKKKKKDVMAVLYVLIPQSVTVRIYRSHVKKATSIQCKVMVMVHAIVGIISQSTCPWEWVHFIYIFYLKLYLSHILSLSSVNCQKRNDFYFWAWEWPIDDFLLLLKFLLSFFLFFFLAIAKVGIFPDAPKNFVWQWRGRYLIT